MNQKLNRILAITGLVFFIAGTVFLTMTMYSSKLLGGNVWLLAALFWCAGFICYLAILITKGFPSQQVKEEKRRKIEEDYYNNLAKDRDSKQNNSTSDAKETANKQDESQDKAGENSGDE